MDDLIRRVNVQAVGVLQLHHRHLRSDLFFFFPVGLKQQILHQYPTDLTAHLVSPLSPIVACLALLACELPTLTDDDRRCARVHTSWERRNTWMRATALSVIRYEEDIWPHAKRGPDLMWLVYTSEKEIGPVQHLMWMRPMSHVLLPLGTNGVDVSILAVVVRCNMHWRPYLYLFSIMYLFHV